MKSTFIRSPPLGYAIVLHAAIRLLEQAQPQIICTQIVNYNPSKALQSKNFVFTVLGYSLKVWFVKLRGYFRILELGSGVGHVFSVGAELHYVSMIALYDGMFRSNNQATTLCGFSKMKSPWSAMLSEHGQLRCPPMSTMTTFTVSPR
jgi:hypothetical protein